MSCLKRMLSTSSIPVTPASLTRALNSFCHWDSGPWKPPNSANRCISLLLSLPSRSASRASYSDVMSCSRGTSSPAGLAACIGAHFLSMLPSSSSGNDPKDSPFTMTLKKARSTPSFGPLFAASCTMPSNSSAHTASEPSKPPNSANFRISCLFSFPSLSESRPLKIFITKSSLTAAAKILFSTDLSSPSAQKHPVSSFLSSMRTQNSSTSIPFLTSPLWPSIRLLYAAFHTSSVPSKPVKTAKFIISLALSTSSLSLSSAANTCLQSSFLAPGSRGGGPLGLAFTVCGMICVGIFPANPFGGMMMLPFFGGAMMTPFFGSARMVMIFAAVSGRGFSMLLSMVSSSSSVQ
mmetsp:Transcript_43938/g.114274  ORF Transcript_43938/g.114274 Transcript_43938/m.114274 type:complete len:350 (-) Transcript_43938:217-1266(-)